MSAWTQLLEPGPALVILVIVLTPQIANAAPFENSDQSTEIEYYPVADATGCYYNFEHYDEGDRIITNEPCLNCTCHNRMLMCYLRVCPFTKAIGQNCKVEKKPDQCCPVITCPEVPVHLVSHASTTPSTQVGHPNDYGCSIDNLFYSDGAKVPSNPENPCEVCYCIRNKTACIIQECTLTGEVVEGCRPVYVDGVCCPVRYDCEHPQIETTPRPLLTTTTTTLPPTSSPSDCIYNNEVYADGALVKKDVPCEQCYCMRGDIICAVQECGPTPLDKVNCSALPPKEGQCCPDTYECENISEEDLTTLSYYEVPTTQATVIASEITIKPEEEIGSPEAETTTPQVSPAEQTERQIIESTASASVEEQTIPEEGGVTESATVEAITSRITDAVEAVTSKVTEIVEAITSSVIGKQEVTEEVTPQPEQVTEEVKQEPETSTVSEHIIITEKATQATIIEAEPLTTDKAEVHTEQEIQVTEGYIQETKIPDSGEQKLFDTTTESKLPVTVAGLPQETENVHTESPEAITEGMEPVAYDDHETEEGEEPHEEENELFEGSGKPPIEQVPPQEPSVTVAPAEETEDRHTRPIDQTESQAQVTDQPEIETSTLLEELPRTDETEVIEGSGEHEPVPTTVAPLSETAEQEKQHLSTVEPIVVTEKSEIATTEFLAEEHTSQPETQKEPQEQEKTSELPIPQDCDENDCHPTPSVTESISEPVQPIEPEVSTEQAETEVTKMPEVQVTITEQEQPHADITKQSEESTLEAQTEASKEKEEEITPEYKKDIPTTVSPPEGEKEEALVTEPSKEGVGISVEESVTDVSKEKESEISSEKPEEELEIVTEISTKETDKPQSMDHVFETVPPVVTTVKPEPEIGEEEISKEKETPGEVSTEAPKEEELEKQPEEKPSEVPQIEDRVTESVEQATTSPGEVSKTPEDCESSSGCAPGQVQDEEIPAVVEECTKESCAPHGAVLQPEHGTEVPVACDSDHGCIPEQESAKETARPAEGCDAENDCIPPTQQSSVPSGHPACDTEHGCAPGEEINIPQPCDDESGCTPVLPEKAEKEGQIPEQPSPEACHPEFGCKEVQSLPESSTTDKISTQEEHTVPFKETEPEEGSGLQVTTEFVTISEEVELPEGSGLSEDHTVAEESPPEESSEKVIPSIVVSTDKLPEEIPEQETEQTIIPVKSTETISVIPETQPEVEEATTVSQEEKVIQPEVTSSPDYETTETAQQIPIKETEAPLLSETSQATEETVTEEGTEVPIATYVPEYPTPAVEEEIENEIIPHGSEAPEPFLPETEKSAGVEGLDVTAPETTQAPVEIETEGIPIHEKVPADHTKPPVSTEAESTQSPEITITDATQSPEPVTIETTQIPKEVTEAEHPQTPEEGSQGPDQVTAIVADVTDANISEETQTAGKVTEQSLITETTFSPEDVPHIPVTSAAESTEKSLSEGTSAPEITESATEIESTEILYGSSQTTEYVPEITEYPEKNASESTEVPEHVTFEEAVTPQQNVETTPGPIKAITESIPEQESSELPIEGVTQPSAEEPSGEVTQTPKEAPEKTEATTQAIPEASPEITETPEKISEGTPAPEIIPDHTQPSTSEQEQPASTEEILHAGTYVPETAGPETTLTPEVIPESSEGARGTESVGTEVPGVTQPSEEGVTEVATEKQVEEHGIPGEGSCLVDGQTYKNNSHVPPINQCQTSCKCISSILQCESVSCTPPPNNLQDCMPIFHSADSCCPTYSCSVPGVTSMESDSHVVETTTAPQEEEKSVTTAAAQEDEKPVTTTAAHEQEKPITTTSTQEEEKPVTITPTQEEEKYITTTATHEEEKPITITPAQEEEQPVTITAPQEKEQPVTITTPQEEERQVTTTATHEEEKPVTIALAQEEEELVTTTAAQEEKSVTTGAPVIPVEETTTKESFSEITPSPEEVGTTKQGEEPYITVKAEEKPESPQEPITELPVSSGTETPEATITEEGYKGTLPEEVTTQEPETSDKVTSPGISVETQPAEAEKETQTTVPSGFTTVSIQDKEIISIEEPSEHGEQQPEFDETENEVPEEPIVPEKCGVDGCLLEPPSVPPTTKHPVTEIIPEKEYEYEEGKEKATESSLKEEEHPATEIIESSEQPVTEEYATPAHIIPSEESTEEKVPETPLPSITELPKEYDGATTQATVDKENVAESETEGFVEEHPSTAETPVVEDQEEVSTEPVSADSSQTEETPVSITERITETSQTPEEIAALPEIEEAATLPSILPEPMTEPVITEAGEEIEGIEKIITTGGQFASVTTEQPSVHDEGGEDEIQPEKETQKPEAAPQTEISKTETIATVTEKYLTEKEAEPQPVEEFTVASPQTEITEPQIIETTSSVPEHITETIVAVTKLESAAHVTEPIEEEKPSEVTTVAAELAPEVTTVHVTALEETEAPVVPQEEIKPEEEIAQGTTAAPAEHESVPSITEQGEHIEPEITTVSVEQGRVTEPSFEVTEEQQTERIATVPSSSEAPEQEEVTGTEQEQTVTDVKEGVFPTHAPIEKETESRYTPSVTEAEIKETTPAPSATEAEQPEIVTESLPTQPAVETVEPHAETTEKYTPPVLTTLLPSYETTLYTSGPKEEPSTKKSIAGELSTSAPLTPSIEPATVAPPFPPAPVPGHDIPGEHVPELPDYHATDDYEYEEQGPLGPGTCRYGGKVYVSAQQIPRDDPCDFCFCFRSDIICLQQSCPPPIPRCHEEPIRGFCCPRYECPVDMAMAVNVTTSTTTTTTTLPPHFLSHAYKGRVKRTGCQIRGRAYQVGEEIKAASGPCLHCTCGGDGEMQCDPKVCSPEPMLRQMIAAAVSRRRR